MVLRNGEGTRGLYRSRHGVVLGVCKGMADYLDFPVIWIRLLWVVGTVFSMGFPGVIAYFVAAVLMKPEPVIPFESVSDREFYDSYTSSRSMAMHRLKRTYESLNRRVQRIESIVTSRDFSWESRMSE